MRHQSLLDRYIDYVGLTRTKSTQQVHGDALRPLLKHWDHLDPEDFTRAEFESYLAYGKNQKKWKPRTMAILIDVSRGFIRGLMTGTRTSPTSPRGSPKVHPSKVR